MTIRAIQTIQTTATVTSCRCTDSKGSVYGVEISTIDSLSGNFTVTASL